MLKKCKKCIDKNKKDSIIINVNEQTFGEGVQIMANKKDYDRWDKTCVKVISKPKTTKKVKTNNNKKDNK